MKAPKKAGRGAILEAPETVATDPDLKKRFHMQGEVEDGRLAGLWLRESVLVKNPDKTTREELRYSYRISGCFDVPFETFDADTQTWGLALRFNDRDGVNQQLVVSRDMFSGEGGDLKSLLARRGLFVHPAKSAGAALCEYLARSAQVRRARVVSRTGWHRIDDAHVFVLPDEVFGRSPIEVVYQPALQEPSVFNSAGALDDWRGAVAGRCIGNTRLVLAVCAACAAPLLDLIGEEGGGLHLRGGSRTGKTTALRVGASVWGGEPGSGAGAFIRQWRITSNAAEGIAASHSDTLLPLDEISEAEGKDVGEVAYMLANGQGKSRLGRDASLRARLRFRTLFLSTGESGLAQKIAEGGGTMRAGQEVRLVDIPADAGVGLGIFQELHGAASAAEFAQVLRDATGRYYGVAARAFLHYLTGRHDRDVEFSQFLRDWQRDLVREWLERHPDAGAQVRSVARRFALVAIAGELATEAAITGWDPHEAILAAQACFVAWLGERGITGAREDAQVIIQMRAFIASGGMRFDDWRDHSMDTDLVGDPDSRPPHERFRSADRAGWRKWTHDGIGPGEWTYYLSVPGMHAALKGLDFRPAVKVLKDRGYLIPGRDGRSARLENPRGHPKARVYVVAASILGAEEAGD
jgi:putative DNA primase/helicase